MEGDLKSKFKQFFHINCSKDPKHSEEQMNMVCLSQSCSKFFEPVCIYCIEEKFHDHKDDFRSIKIFLQKVIDMIDTPQEQDSETTKWAQEISKKFKMLSEQCYVISEQILQQSKGSVIIDNAKAVMSQVISNSLDLQEGMTKLKNLILLDDQGVLKFKLQLNEVEQDYRQKIINYYQKLENIIVKTKNTKLDNFSYIRTMNTDEIHWNFTKSANSQNKSQNIEESEAGIEFQCTSQGTSRGDNQIIYSNQSFEGQGIHFFKIQLEEIESNKGLFIFSIFEEDLIDQDPNKSPFVRFDSVNRGFSKLIKLHPQQLTFNQFLNKGETISVSLDMDQQTLTLSAKNIETYKLYYNLTGKLRFAIWFAGNKNKIRLLASY